MSSPKKNNGPWTKVTQVALPVMFTALLGVIAFLGQQVLALRSDMAKCQLEDVKRDLELQKDLALYKVYVDNLSSKVDKLELALEERRNEETGMSNRVGDTSLDLGSFFVDSRATPDEDHQRDPRGIQ